MVWFLESLTASIIPNAPLRIKPKLAPAWGAEVVSSNSGGYNKIQLVQGYNLVGAQFSQVGGGDRDFATSFILDDTFAGYTSGYQAVSKLRVWDPVDNSYTTFGWAGDSGSKIDDDEALDYTWVDQDCEAVEGETLPPTEGVWILAEKAGTALVSGEVVTTNMTVNLVTGYNIVCNPYPCEVPVATFGRLDNSFAGYTSGYQAVSKLRVWDPVDNSYTTYGWAGDSGSKIDDDEALDYTWVDQDCEATNDKIPVGAAVWILAEKAGTMTFTSPISE